ncbi:D-alanyl-lipoteichoic acid acyltransferase DltB (MBOAT superfamily) [Algoriphagus iocasae]|uniref:D-alanyl-lipoteichoic acid acyltransferase DltB (MBOAT superfamily) n=1 Tax=Algoriphagus iocasae TaxID=1836499 RepID=A0A841MLN1_9BACT|nr:MBOAT family O-acyltransferase [Algoriphagus iocasae]MBB6327783.1 D-alanyl-lipoteichoic acid acyltransferase DltB (MBOAT superfamily) [Algoriphagus iocasae]
MSYTIDIYREKIEPSQNLIGFLTFVSFFPQLVAGPIERASNLLPQFFKERKFNYEFAVSGVKIIIWGLFKKMVIADNASVIVDGIFQDYSNQSTGSLLIGMIFFAFQIYGDFSGYSDIAIGTSRLFGFDLMTNFKFPYLSKNISEFWKRWHISLSSWFRDYLYIPLGGSRNGKWRALVNVIIVFIISGIWHGANWTFLVWGSIHGLLYLPVFILRKEKDEEFTIISLKNIVPIILTFGMTCLAWVYFRSNTVYDANQYLVNLFASTGTTNLIFSTSKHLLITGFVFIGIFLLMGIEIYFSLKKKVEVTLNSKMLVALCILILFMAAFKNPISFIYFQF